MLFDSLVSSDGPGSQYQGTDVTGNVAVTYEYAPVPLPPAAWLMLSGLAGLGVIVRRQTGS